jgi:hypothetical protein
MKYLFVLYSFPTKLKSNFHSVALHLRALPLLQIHNATLLILSRLCLHGDGSNLPAVQQLPPDMQHPKSRRIGDRRYLSDH